MLQPADSGWFGRGPGRRFPGSGAEVQALAGSADEFGPVTVGQAPGDERPRPGPAGGMPADLERAAPVRPAADRMDPDIKRAHVSYPPSATLVRQRSPDRQLQSPADPGSRPRLGGHQEGQRDDRAGPAQNHNKPAAAGSCQPAGYGHRKPQTVSATACLSAIHPAPNAEYSRLPALGRLGRGGHRSASSGHPQARLGSTVRPCPRQWNP